MTLDSGEIKKSKLMNYIFTVTMNTLNNFHYGAKIT